MDKSNIFTRQIYLKGRAGDEPKEARTGQSKTQRSGAMEWTEMIFRARKSKISSVTDSRGIEYE